MLRNRQESKQIFIYLTCLTQQHRCVQQKPTLCNKSSSVVRQAKIFSKLFGQRVSGSKKRWIPAVNDSTQLSSSNIFFNQSQFAKIPRGQGKNATRRMTVLNKLFMEHITDLLATGEISESILGKGLQISRVKVSPDFAYVNVFWLPSGQLSKDNLLEQELQCCSGLLRHELSQLRLMGEVPRIKFVRDKLFLNMNQIETLLSSIDFGPEEEELHESDFQNTRMAETLKQEFYGNGTNNIAVIKPVDRSENNKSLKTLDYNVPEMRHDVLGLDHKAITLKILTKMRKSKQAWEQHFQNSPPDLDNSSSERSRIHSASFDQLARINDKLANAAANSENFEAFLAKRKQKHSIPERKKFRPDDHIIDDVNQEEHDYPESLMSRNQRQIFEAEDYLPDDIEDKNYK